MTQLTAGKPEPLGASFDGKGVNFTLFSAHAERVELCVFDGEGNEHRYDLPARTGDTGTVTWPEVGRGCTMAFACTVRGNPRRDTGLTLRSC